MMHPRSTIKKTALEQIPFLLSLPAFLWQTYFLFIPLLFIVVISVTADRGSGNWYFTLHHYGEILTSMHAKVLFNSALLSCIAGASCVLIGYPVAYYLAMRAGKMKHALLVFLILPSWTSFIIQIYSWFYLLQKNGLFSSLFSFLGFTSHPVSLLNSYGATVLGMVYCYLPFMILPLYTVLEKMDKRLLEASADLGASPWQTFTRIVWPLSRSGVRVGLALVMVPAFGEFAIPDLMGGVKDLYVGRMIMEKFLVFRDWHSGAAIVMVSFVIPIVCAFLGVAMSKLSRHVLTED